MSHVVTLTAPRGGTSFNSYQPVIKVWKISYNAGTNTWSHNFINQFQPFGGSFTRGINIACGNVDVDTPNEKEEIIAATGFIMGLGLQSQEIRIFKDWAQQLWAETGFPPTKGLRVGVGDIDGDSIGEVVVGNAYGLDPPEMWVFNWDPVNSVLVQRHWTNTWTGNIYGWFVDVGNVRGDNRCEILFGAGAGYGATVWVFDEDPVSGNLQFIHWFYTREPGFQGGATLSVGKFR